MPPKKSGKKKKGKKSGKKSATKPSAATSEQLSELSKEYYLIQIRDLENRLARYQKKCDELEVMNKDFRREYDQLSTDKKEIVSFLKKSLEQRGDEITDLNDRLIGLQQAKDTEKEQMETENQALRTEFQDMKDRLTSENMILHGKLASLEEFKVQKEDLMAKFANMEDKLKKQEEHHQEVIYNLERKQVVDKDRLKKEMVMRVNQVAAEFRKVSNKQMAETTKRTIRENVSINAQLSKMSDKTLELIDENDELSGKEKKMRQQLDMLEANEKELAKKNHSNQKIIRMLTEKCRNQEAVIDELEMREQEYAELGAEADLYRQQVESSREELQKLARENDLLEEDLKLKITDLHEERRNKHKLERIIGDCSGSLKQALSTTTPEDVEESPHEQVEKRNNMLENLLILLNSAAALGLGPSPGTLGRSKEEKRIRSASKIPGSSGGIRRGEMTPVTPVSTAPHYQLGDLGLIPRPAHHIQTHSEKVKELSANTRLGSLKKVLTKSVAVQTVSTPKAMFFADQLMGRLPNQGQLIHQFDTTQMSLEKQQLSTGKKVPSQVF